MSISVDSSDVLKLIQQFLKENHLTRSLEALQEETGVYLNISSPEDSDMLAQNIMNGKWDLVLKALASRTQNSLKLMDLYEQIMLEMIAQQELNAARHLLRQTDIMQILRERQPDRYIQLEQLLTKASLETHVKPNQDWTERRKELARQLCSEFTTVPSGRLLTLISQALKWQLSKEEIPHGFQYDLLHGVAARSQESEGDVCPAKSYATIKFGRKNHVESAAFSPDGEFFATGTVDGFIEIWNHLTGKLRKDLKYQDEENIMGVPSAVLSLAFSDDSEYLACGTQDGQIYVWRVKTGTTIRVFERAHSGGIVSLQFSSDGTQILSTGFDHVVRIYGLKSGKMIKEFRGHTSFVNRAIFIGNGGMVLSVSSDGSLRCWDAKTSICMHQASPNPTGSAHMVPTLLSIQSVPRRPDVYLVCFQSSCLALINSRGKMLRLFHLPDKIADKTQFVAAVCSAQGDLIYGATSDGHLYAFSTETGTLLNSLQLHTTEIIGLTTHPLGNVLVSFADDGQVHFWRP